MAGTGKRCLFVPDRAEARLLVASGGADPDLILLPLNRATATVLDLAGFAWSDPSLATGETEKAAALEAIVAAALDVENRLVEALIAPGRSAIVALRLLRALSTAVNLDMARQDAEASILSDGRLEPWSPTRHIAPTEPAAKNGSTFTHLPLLHPFGREFAFDMRSNKVRTAPIVGMPRFVRLSADPGASTGEVVARNTAQALRNRLRRDDVARALIAPGRPQAPDPHVAAALGASPLAGIPQNWSPAVIAHALSLLGEVEACRITIDSLLVRHGANLRVALFDFPTKPLEVALAEACAQRGVPTVVESHGCVSVHGDGVRRAAAKILAGGGYNWIADASHIVPRSPTQVLGMNKGPQIVRINRTQPEPPAGDNADLPFRILLAANFVAWSLSVPALTASCFEIFSVIEKLAETVAALPGFALDLRVKVTTADTPSARQMVADRGLVPADVAPLLERFPAMRDVSAMSYSAVMEEADLVVTEGLTAVMIEALEYRKPVLLMNRFRERTPSLPAWRLADLTASGERNAVYACGCDEDVTGLLGAIAARHGSRPLTDAELAQWCWTGGERAPAGGHVASALGLA